MKTGNREYPAEFYDKIYALHDKMGTGYGGDPSRSSYASLWNAALKWIHKYGLKTIIDLGCGPGQFLELAKRGGLKVVCGVDFSPEAIRMAKARFPKEEAKFICEGLLDKDARWPGYQADVVTSFEVFEHIADDLGVIGRIKPGTRLIFSVPTYVCENHVRIFRTPEEVIERYSPLLEIRRVIPVRKKVIWLTDSVVK